MLVQLRERILEIGASTGKIVLLISNHADLISQRAVGRVHNVLNFILQNIDSRKYPHFYW